jgi:hypothetical protein
VTVIDLDARTVTTEDHGIVTVVRAMTDDEIVDAFARLRLAVSRERPAIAQAPGASSPRETGGEDRSYVG